MRMADSQRRRCYKRKFAIDEDEVNEFDIVGVIKSDTNDDKRSGVETNKRQRARLRG